MPEPEHGNLWKYDKEPHVITRRKLRTEIMSKRATAKHEAKKRDSHRCRWPREDHDTPGKVCLGQIEAAHKVAIGMGGEKQPLSRTSTGELFTACTFIHQTSRDALERHGRSWEPLTEHGADGPVAFLRRQPDGTHVEFARERQIGVLETI